MKPAVLVAVLLGFAIVARPVHAEIENFSRLAVPKLAPTAGAPQLLKASETPKLWLAQRVIEREWGASEDSTYVELELPGYKSEGWAMAMSAVVPGAGQLYVGEGSGWWFLLGELAGWGGRQLLLNKADDFAADAANFVGNPFDSSSTWSFARYQYYTGGDVQSLQQLWTVDRDAYFTAILRDARYLDGFSGSRPENTFLVFRDLRDKRDQSLVRARYLETALIVNHLFAAWDAMRAARFQNLPLERRRGTQLKLGERWGDSGPELRAALVRNF